MSLVDFVQLVVALTSALTIVGGAAAVLVKLFASKAIGHFFDLQADKLRASLQRAGFEHQTKFARLHEKRAETIEKLYVMLLEGEDSFARVVHYTAGIRPDPWKAYKAIQALKEFFEPNQIFLSEQTALDVGEYLRRARGLSAEVTFWVSEDGSIDPKQRPAIVKSFEDLTAVRKALEGRFRQMLGVGRDDA